MTRTLIIDGTPATSAEVLDWWVSDPEMKEHLNDLPGSDGTQDWSTAYTGGEPIWKDRALTIIVNEKTTDHETKWDDRVSQWSGRTLKLGTSDQPGWWKARVVLSNHEWTPHDLRYLITARVNPWLFDELETSKIGAAGVTIHLPGTHFRVAPIFTTTVASSITIGQSQYEIPAGYNRSIRNLYLPANQFLDIRVNTGSVTIHYQGGKLL